MPVIVVAVKTEAAVPETRIAKLYWNGGSQVVQLPAEFRFEGTEVHATRDERRGDVVLSARSAARTWAEFFALMRSINVPAEFVVERPMNALPTERGVFDDAE